jgi:subtilisin family serine protease
MLRNIQTISIALIFVIGPAAFGLLLVCGTAVAAEHVSSWILVRLDEPLASDGPDKDLPLTTGLPEVDTMVALNGVHRIDHALGVSMRDPHDREGLRRYGLDRTYRFHVPEGTDVVTLVEKLSRLPGVDFAELDYFLRPQATTPNDPMFPDQWDLQQAYIDAPEAWDRTTGTDIIIAVIDTGLDLDHPEFAGKYVNGWNFVADSGDVQDTHWHGSAVSSIAAANTNNNLGMAGVCWGCRIMPLVVVTLSHMADALIWATDNGARVVNISQGQTAPLGTFTAALAYAYDAGLVVVASAGNENLTPILYPARYLETIAVGATNDRDVRAQPFCFNSEPGSNYGPAVDVVAPGDLIIAADSTGGYLETACGTSFAAPIVAGLAGLIESLAPSAGREEVRHLIRAGAEDQVGRPTEDVPGFDPYHGWGRLNLEQTLQAAEASMSLRVEGKQNTRAYFDTANLLADSYDFIRGDLSSLSETYSDVDLGDVVCL